MSTCNLPTVEDILSNRIIEEDTEEASEEEDCEVIIPSNKEATEALEILKRYVAGSTGGEECFKPLYTLEKHVNELKLQKMKSRLITDFFEHK